MDDQELSFGKHVFEVKPNSWFTVVIEIGKGILSFGTSRSASYRNLRVYEALPNPEWEQKKSALTKSLAPIGK